MFDSFRVPGRPPHPAPGLMRALRWLALTALASLATLAPAADYFAIHVVDEATGRGVPLVELKTTHNIRYFTDNNGYVAFDEPGLLRQRVFFSVSSPGYEFPKDGFGLTGVALDVKPGGRATLKVKRRNLAERLYRVTGGGLYRDSVLLGEPVPVREPLLNGQVLGQDSVQPIVHRDRLYWFWGDTSRPSYPLGNFHASGATSALPDHGGLDPAQGVDLTYFTNNDGFAKGMASLPGPGAVWFDGLVVVPDATGRERMVVHFARMKDLGKRLEQGLLIYDDAKDEFVRLTALDNAEQWRFLQNHPIRFREGEQDYFYTLWPDRAVRVKADLAHLQDPASYEAFTCATVDPASGHPNTVIQRDASGRLLWAWRTNAVPLSTPDERKLITAGKLSEAEARFQLRDLDTGKPIVIHTGTVNWNDFRKQWIMIGVQYGGTSFLGEVWYAEAGSPLGPWGPAKKIVTHNRYSFYNPIHHPCFDQQGGRLIYFEGTYSVTFSGNEDPTPRYDYNQIMYRLDLSDPRLTSKSNEPKPARN
jgi:hypothetical protein